MSNEMLPYVVGSVKRLIDQFEKDATAWYHDYEGLSITTTPGTPAPASNPRTPSPTLTHGSSLDLNFNMNVNTVVVNNGDRRNKGESEVDFYRSNLQRRGARMAKESVKYKPKWWLRKCDDAINCDWFGGPSFLVKEAHNCRLIERYLAKATNHHVLEGIERKLKKKKCGKSKRAKLGIGEETELPCVDQTTQEEETRDVAAVISNDRPLSVVYRNPENSRKESASSWCDSGISIASDDGGQIGSPSVVQNVDKYPMTIYENDPIYQNLQQLLGPGGHNTVSRKEQKTKLQHIIAELIDSEERYIQTLDSIVKDYMDYFDDIEMPPNLIGKQPYLFGNIRHILTETMHFYDELITYSENWRNVSEVFIRNKSLFELYYLYARNKPKADEYLQGDFKFIVQMRQIKLKQQMDLHSNLIAPIQRLSKYMLLLKNMRKELLKGGESDIDVLSSALSLIQSTLTRSNDVLAISSITQWPPIEHCQLGSYVMRDSFMLKTSKTSKRHEIVVFLFDELIILTDVNRFEQFIFKLGLPMSEISIAVLEDEPLRFALSHFPSKKSKRECNYLFEARDPKIKELWSQTIFAKLFEQFQQCKENQQMRHIQEGRRPSLLSLASSKLN